MLYVNPIIFGRRLSITYYCTSRSYACWDEMIAIFRHPGFTPRIPSWNNWALIHLSVLSTFRRKISAFRNVLLSCKLLYLRFDFVKENLLFHFCSKKWSNANILLLRPKIWGLLRIYSEHYVIYAKWTHATNIQLQWLKGHVQKVC